jgi:transcriptional regulator with XRE-family HTH domain
MIELSSKIDKTGEVILRIKSVLDSKGMTRKQLAELTGFSRGHVSDILNGKVLISDRFIQIVCSTLDVNEGWVLTGQGGISADLTDKIIEMLRKYPCVRHPVYTLIKKTVDEHEQRKKGQDQILSELYGDEF